MRKITRSWARSRLMTETTGNWRLSGSVTKISVLPPSTWKFVAIQPSLRTMKPVPSESRVRIDTTDGVERAAISAGDRSEARAGFFFEAAAELGADLLDPDGPPAAQA